MASMNRPALLHDCQIAVLMTDGVEEAGLLQPIEAFRQEGARLTLIAPQEGWVQSFRGLEPGRRFRVDQVLEQVRPDRFDALYLPGGVLGVDLLRSEPRILQFVREMDEAQKPIGTLGHAAWLLISAGRLRGHRLTSHPSIADDVRNAGGQWIDLPVVSERHWVSSRGLNGDLPLFTRELTTQLARATPPVISVSVSA